MVQILNFFMESFNQFWDMFDTVVFSEGFTLKSMIMFIIIYHIVINKLVFGIVFNSGNIRSHSDIDKRRENELRS